jgi:plasmid stabilization system protein ParE
MPKHYSVTIHPAALDDLDRLYCYIAEDSLPRAEKFVAGLKKKILELERFPRRGRVCHLFDSEKVFDEVRLLAHKGYLVFYEIEKSSVTIYHITGPGQDWMSLFI